MDAITALAGRRFGPVAIIPGARSSVFPNCTSLYVDGGRERAIIDPGAGEEALGVLGRSATCLMNTHYHFDHIWGNHLFPGLPVLLNEVERMCFPDLEAVGRRLGVRQIYGEAGVAEWIAAVRAAAGAGEGGAPSALGATSAPYSPAFRPEWWLSTRTPAGSYPYGEYAVGSVRMVMVHTPGHTEGFCCPYFPDEGLVYTGDVDLTSFGPWYAGSDGDIDAFIRTARALLDLDADWYLTGHQEGLLTRDDFAGRLEAYLAIIDDRDDRILGLLAEGMPEAEVVRNGVVYPARYHGDPFVRMWETVAVGKHLERRSTSRRSTAARASGRRREE